MKFYTTLLMLILTVGIYGQEGSTFDNARTIAAGVTTSLTKCPGTENVPFYYRTKTPANGTISLQVSATNQSANTGYTYIRVYDARKQSGQLLASYVQTSSVASGTTASETFKIPGRLIDSVFISVITTKCFGISLSYQIKDTPPQDAEPNDNINMPVSIAANAIKQGNIEYMQAGVADDNDYYLAVLPQNGTMNIDVEATNTSAGNGYLYAYAYDSRKLSGQIAATYIRTSSVPVGNTIRDTIVLKGRANDTVYIRLIASQAFRYNLSYFMTEVYTSDSEPNASFDASVKFNVSQTKEGIIGYYSKGTADQDDYYATKLPQDAAMKIFVEATNRDAGNGYVYMYGYDERKASGLKFAKYISSSNVKPGITVYDTIIVYGQLADSFYLRVTSSAAFHYKLRYEMVQETVSVDQEPNNTFDEAIALTPGSPTIARIQYTSGGATDDKDYYKATLPGIGTMRIIVNGTNQGSSTGYMYLYAYDSRKASGQLLADYVKTSGVAAGAAVADTFYIFGRRDEMHYIQLTATSPFNYSIQYDLVNPVPVDPEPNDLIAESVFINEATEHSGNIGYRAGANTDNDDFYKLTAQQNGTLQIPIRGTNNGNSSGYLYVRVYDKRGLSGQLFAGYMQSSNIAKNTTLFDTIYIAGAAAGDYYIDVESSGYFGYSVQYNITQLIPQEPEPNGTFVTADTLQENMPLYGNIGYRNGIGAGIDEDDYYILKLLEPGTLKIVVNGRNKDAANGYMYLYVYDKRGNGGQILATYVQGSNIGVGNALTDTFLLRGRDTGTYYFRFTSTKAFEYDISYLNVDKVPVDDEENGSFATAIPLTIDSIANGNIGYVNQTTDQDDYYAGKLPKYGTLRVIFNGTNMGATNGYIYNYGYDGRKQSGQLFAKYAQGSNITPGASVTDTILISCRAIDSFYMRITSNGSWQYSWKYEMTDTSVAEKDTNNTFITATPLPLNSVLADNIGYVTKGTNDASDYFITALPSNGTVKYIVKAKNTSMGNAYVYAYIYGKNGTAHPQLAARYLGGSSSLPAGTMFTDTFTLDCTTWDTVYLRITSTGCFSYEVTPAFIDQQPVITAMFDRIGNEFGFMAEQENTSSFVWNFSDNTSSTSYAPYRAFKPGYYTVQAIGTNQLCNYKDTSTLNFDVFGVEYFTPDKSATGGDGIMTLYGGGLDSSVQITLTKGSQTLIPREVYGNGKKNVLTAEFDFHFAETGTYNVSITLPNIDTLQYPNAFTITPFEYPYTTAKVIVPTRWRTNQWRDLELSVENHGSVVANGVRLAVAWPKTVEVEWFNELRPIVGGIDSVPDGNAGWYTVPRENLAFMYDSLDTQIPITVLQGKPYDGYIRYFYLPHVPANSSVEVPFKAKAPTSGIQEFVAFTNHPNIYGSCDTEATLAAEDLMQAELLDFVDEFADKSKIPVFQAFTKTAKVGRKHAGSASAYYGKKFWAWYDGYEFDGDAAMADLIRETEANNKYALETLVKETGGFVGGKALGSANKAIESRVKNINGTLARNPGLSPERFDKYLDILNSTNDQAKRVEILEKMYTGVKDFDKALSRAQALEKIAADCPELKAQLEELKKNSENEHNHQNTTRNKSETRTSWDPNDIFGPVGSNSDRYVNVKDIQHFTIAFENVDTAKADAQIVIVKDTIDKKVFDLETFEFGAVTVGTKYLKVPAGRQQFVLDHLLNDSIRLRIQGRLDTATGEAQWIFTSLDATTGQLPDFAGFLPPNVNKPEGEGYVAYKVQPLSTVPHLTALKSKALIYFDDNAPIATGTWQNIIDKVSPTSQVTGTKTSDTTVTLHFTGIDLHAGVGSYNVYARRNGGDWLKIGRLATDTMPFLGSLDSTYAFYAIAEDSIRNIEVKGPAEEYSITFSNTPLPVSLITFTGVAKADGNELLWTTSSESNNRGFYVESSLDGQNFVRLTLVPSHTQNGNSNSTQRYTFIHSNPAAKNYYRLTQEDFDGNTKRSNIVRVSREEIYSYTIAPNPVRSSFTVQSNGKIENIRLLDITGRELRRYNPAGNAVYSLPAVSPGIYLLQVTIDGKMTTERIQVIR